MGLIKPRARICVREVNGKKRVVVYLQEGGPKSYIRPGEWAIKTKELKRILKAKKKIGK